jgi:hypothetical protein
MNEPLASPKPKSRFTLWTVLSFVGFAVLMSVQQTCQKDNWQKQKAKEAAFRAEYQTIVWITGPSGGLIPRRDVQILDQGPSFVKFRTKEGELFEQHGAYRIETRKRNY